MSATGGEAQTLWTGEEVASADAWGSGGSFSSDGTVTAVIRQAAGTPPEVWAGPIGKWKQITHLNSGIQPAWGAMRNIHWQNGSTRVEGWLMLPKGFVPRQNISARSQRARRTFVGVHVSLE